MKKSLYLAMAFLLPQMIAPNAMAAEPQACATVGEKEIAALFDRWNASLQTKDPAAVAANYAPDAVLLPTVSNKVRKTPDEIKDYFVHFLEKSPKGKIDSRTIHIGCNEAFDVGTYTFTLTGPDGKAHDVAARYTYVYTLKDGKWLIAHHHSSAMPEKMPAHPEKEHKAH